MDVVRRDGARVTRVVLISTPPLSEQPQAAVAREARIVVARIVVVRIVVVRSGRFAEALAGEVPEAALADTPWRGEVLAVLRDMGMGLGEGVFLRQSRATQRRPDQQKTMRRVKIPALVMGGVADSFLPVRRQEFTAGLMPWGKLCVIDGAGHVPSLEQPNLVAEAIEGFLNRPLMSR